MQTEMLILGETQTYIRSFPLQIAFFPVLFASSLLSTYSRESL